MLGLRVLTYDAMENSPVGWSWAIGAQLYRPWFDAVIPCKSWYEWFKGLQALTNQQQQPIREIQYWGHGSPGKPLINRSALEPTLHQHLVPLQDLAKVLTRPALLWFRCCSVFFGQSGKDYAEAMSTVLGCDVAAHTYKIGFWHSGLHTARPGVEPGWSIHEGRGEDCLPMSSGTTKPNTIPFFRMTYPTHW